MKVTRCWPSTASRPSGRGFHAPSANASGVGGDGDPEVVARFGRLGFSASRLAPCGAKRSPTVSTVPWNLLSRSAEASPTSDIRCHGAVVARHLPRQLPTASPRSAWPHPKVSPRSASRGHALSDTPHRRGHALSIARRRWGSRIQTPVIVPISRCALASSSGASSPKRGPLSYDPVFASGARLAPGSSSSLSTSLALPRRRSRKGRGRLGHAHLTVARPRRSHGSRFRALVHPLLGLADGGDPGRHRPMSATHDSVFKTGTQSSRHTPLRDPSRRGGSRFTAFEPASAFAAAYTGACSSPAASPRVPRMLRHPRVPRQNATRASTGVARVPRTDARARGSPPMVETCVTAPRERRRIRRWSEASSASAASRSPTFGVRPALAASDRSSCDRPVGSSLRATAEALQCSLFNRPRVHSPLRSRPSRGRGPRSSHEAPPAGAGPRGPRFAAPEVSTPGSSGSRRDSSFTRLPRFAASRHLRHRAGDPRSWALRHPPTRSRPSRPARGRSDQVPSTTDTGSTGAELAPRARGRTTCLCDRSVEDPRRGSPQTFRLDSRWAANPPPSVAASRWLLRPKARKLVFATFE